MNKSILPWIFWSITLIASIVCAIVFPFTYNMTFFIAALGLLTSFALTAFSFRRKATDRSQLLGLPVLHMAVSTLFVQMVVSFVLMYFAGRCSYIIAVIVEGLVLMIHAAALTVYVPQENQQTQASEEPAEPEE